jgi:carbon starvation protein
VTTTAAYQKIFSQDIRVGFLAAARDLTDKINTGLIEDNKISITHQLIFNQKLDAFITLFLLIILWTVVIDMLRISFFKKKVISYVKSN